MGTDVGGRAHRQLLDSLFSIGATPVGEPVSEYMHQLEGLCSNHSSTLLGSITSQAFKFWGPTAGRPNDMKGAGRSTAASEEGQDAVDKRGALCEEEMQWNVRVVFVRLYVASLSQYHCRLLARLEGEEWVMPQLLVEVIDTYNHAHSPPPPPAYFNTAARIVPGSQGEVNARQKERAGQEEGGQQETGEEGEQKVSASEEGVGVAGEKGLVQGEQALSEEGVGVGVGVGGEWFEVLVDFVPRLLGGPPREYVRQYAQVYLSLSLCVSLSLSLSLSLFL